MSGVSILRIKRVHMGRVHFEFHNTYIWDLFICFWSCLISLLILYIEKRLN